MKKRQSKKIHLTALMMVKNEEQKINVTLESLKGWIDSLTVYDTGSTDRTVDILKDFSEKNGVPLRLKIGEFEDFSTSRNISLDFVDSFSDVDFVLLMDCNDQLRGGENLRELIKNERNTKTTGYLTCQQWWSGELDSYYTMRLIKPRSGWRYKGLVHEWMYNTTESKEAIVRIPNTIVIYQDRTQDDDKSGKRFHRDRELLLKDFKKNPKEARTVFYLAQTCSCLKLNEEAFYYYKLRMELKGFEEEKFHSYLRCGFLATIMKHPWEEVVKWYIKAAEHSNRAEPYMRISQHYLAVKNWFMAYHFIKIACSIEYPSDAILFVNKRAYDYDRWHILGIVSYYVDQIEDGKRACLKAIEAGFNKERDTNNLKFYEQKEREKLGITGSLSLGKEGGGGKGGKSLSKKKFMEKAVENLKKECPNLSLKQLSAKAKLLWKKERNVKGKK